MKKIISRKNRSSSSKAKEAYYQEIFVKPAKRLLDALLKAGARTF